MTEGSLPRVTFAMASSSSSSDLRKINIIFQRGQKHIQNA